MVGRSLQRKLSVVARTVGAVATTVIDIEGGLTLGQLRGECTTIRYHQIPLSIERLTCFERQYHVILCVVRSFSVSLCVPASK